MDRDAEVPEESVALSDEEITTLLDDPTPPAAPVPDPAPPAESPDTPPPAPEPPVTTPPVAQATPPAPPTASTPVASKPFTFTVDGKELSPTDAKLRPDGIIEIPKTTWDNQIRYNLADRTVWRQKEQGFQRQIQQLQTTRSQKEAEAQHVLGEMGKLLTPGNEEALIQFVQNLQVHGPALMAKAEAAGVKAQLEALQAEQKMQVEGQQAEAAVPLLQHALGATVERYLEHPDFAALKPEGVEVLQFLWSDYRDKLFTEDPRGDILLPNGDRATINHEALAQVLSREAKLRTRLVQTATTVSNVAQRNAAALAPTPVPGQKPRPSTPKPKQTPVTSAARDFKGRFMAWDPTKDDDL